MRGVKINVTGINIVGGLVGIIYFCNIVLLKGQNMNTKAPAYLYEKKQYRSIDIVYGYFCITVH